MGIEALEAPDVLAAYNAVKAKLVPGIENIAAVDFDNTCIYNDVGEATLAYICRNSLLRDNYLLDEERELDVEYHKDVFEHYHKLLEAGNVQEAYEFAPMTLSGFTENEVYDLVKETIDFEGREIGKQELFGRTIAKGIRPKPESMQFLDLLRKEDMWLWVGTASAKPIVQAALDYFDIRYHNLIGMETELDRGVLTKRAVYPTTTFDGKVTRIQDEMEKQGMPRNTRPVVGIGDSKNDQAMLEYALVQVVSDRETKFADEARKKGWFLIPG